MITAQREIRAEPLQQVQDPFGAGPYGGAERVGEGRPLPEPQRLGVRGEDPLQVVQDLVREASGERGERGGVREVRQGPVDERGAAGGKQPSGLGVAPLGAQADHQPLGEPVPAAVPDDPGQLPAQGAGGAGEGRPDRLVRDALGAGGAQGVPATTGSGSVSRSVR